MAETHRILGDNAWVEFKESGYPFSLRRKLKEAIDDEALIAIIAPYVSACHLPKVNGSLDSPVISIGSVDDLAQIDERLTTKLIWEFYDFRAERVREPVSKNN